MFHFFVGVKFYFAFKEVENLKKHPEVAEFMPVVGEYVTGRPMKSLSLESLQETAKARATAELQKRGLPTSLEEAQSKVQTRLTEEAQKRGLPTSTADIQSRATQELQTRLPSVPMTASGKRFSTQKRKHSKWPRTRRSKSAKV